MQHRIPFALAAVAAIAIAGACQRNGETQMRPASGVDPNYQHRGYMQEESTPQETEPDTGVYQPTSPETGPYTDPRTEDPMHDDMDRNDGGPAR